MQDPSWFKDPHILGALGNSMMSPATKQLTSHNPASATTTANTYLEGLAAAANLVDKAVSSNTNVTRRKHVQEFMTWLSDMALEKSMQTVTPEDLAVYLTQHLLPNHGGSQSNSNKPIAAPSSLAALKSHFSTEFELLGRTGNWNASTLQGNPTKGPLLQRLVQGYKSFAAEHGYEQKGAVPLTEEDMIQLLQHLHSQQATSSGTPQLLLIRDGLALSILWQGTVRGFNAGGIRLENIRLPTNDPALPFLVTAVQLPANAKIHLMLDRTKNKKGGYCTITLSRDVLCFSSWLQLSIDAHLAAGQPITNYLVRPLLKGTSTFAEKGMDASSIWQRLAKHLKDCNMYAGQSVHSIRRGKMMHINNQPNGGWEEAGEAAMILTKQVVLRYVDEHRPTNYRAKLNSTK